MTTTVFHQRVLHGTDIDLEFVPRAADGTPRTLTTTPTVAVTRISDGAAVLTEAVTPAAPAAAFTAKVLAANNDGVDEFTAVWTADGVDHQRLVQIVGGVYFDTTDAAADGHDVYAGTTVAPERRAKARQIAELECERITKRAWVPQIRRHQVLVRWDDRELVIPDLSPRSLRSVTEHDTTGAVSFTWTAADLAAVHLHDYGSIERLHGNWRSALTTIIYDHGTDGPPFDLVEMVARRSIWWMSRTESAIPDQAVSWSAAEGGGNFRLDRGTPGRTGDRDVDAVYLDYAADDDQIVAP